MSKLVQLVIEKNAAEFKQLFEEKLAEKVFNALNEAKIKTAKKLSDKLSFNTADDKSQLNYDSRGFIGRKSIPHTGGLSNPK
jgi:hypothetical protein